MNFSRMLRHLAVGQLLILAGVAAAQETQHVAQPWTGPMGLRRTVEDIMRLQAITPKRQWVSKRTEKEGPERRELPQNPESPATGIWPIPNGRTALGSDPIDRGGPLFSSSTSFTGATSADTGFMPPDTMGDVSHTQAMVVINGRIKVFSKLGVAGALDADLDTFFSSVHGGPGVADPRCRFDRLTNRWIVLAMGMQNSNNRIVLAVSDSATIGPGTVWTFFQFQHNLVSPSGNNNQFFDYPTMGVDSKAIYVGGSLFAGGFQNTSLFVIRKSSILGAGPMVVSVFRNVIGATTGMFTAQGVDNDDPNSTDGYFIGVDNFNFGKLIMRRVTDPGGSPTLSADISLTIPTTSFPKPAPAPGSSNPLDTLDDRLMVAKLHRNAITGAQTLWTTHSVSVNTSGTAADPGLSSSRAAARWYEFGDVSGTPTLLQSGTVFDSAVSGPIFHYIPSIAMNRQGHTLIGFTRSGSSLNASTGMAFRLAGTTLGTTSAPVTLFAGQPNYNLDGGSPQRWGDYSHTVVDPSDGMSVWTFQEYTHATNSFGVRVHRLQAPPPATISNVSPSSASQGQTLSVTVSGTSVAGSGFFDPGEGFPNRLQAEFSGTGVTVNSVTFTSPTQITLDVTVGGTATAGARTLIITNPDGQSVNLPNAFTVNAVTAIPITGVITLKDYVASAKKQILTLLVRNPGSFDILQEVRFRPTTDAGGYSIEINVPPGTYDLLFFGPTWLRRKLTDVVIPASGKTVSTSLANGNASDGITVNKKDREFVTALLGLTSTDPGYKVRADLDGSGVIDNADLAIVEANFGRAGAK